MTLDHIQPEYGYTETSSDQNSELKILVVKVRNSL